MTAFERGTNVHLVGVGGAGMSGLARLLFEMGCVVSGSDSANSPTLDELRTMGVRVAIGHNPHHVASADVVSWSPAVALDNVELVAARERHATLFSRGDLLAHLASHQPVIGLTGTHGKTTATSMMAHVLLAAGRDDSRLLGAPVPGVGANGHWGSEALLMEVDESYGTFAHLVPHALGLLNVEPDHLDHYGTLEALEAAFAQLVSRTTGPVVLWNDDAGAQRVRARALREVTTVGATSSSQWRVSGITLARREASFTLTGPGHELSLTLRVTGAHNVANASVVAVLALALAIDGDSVRDGLASFRGAPRRFQFLGSWRGVDVYEDYAHLPGEIVATLAGARAAGYERITAVFQPHRVTRTQHLASSFATAFADATNVVISDIYTAGEANPQGLTGATVARGVERAHPTGCCVYAATFADVLDSLESLHDDSDLIVLLGAGDIATVATQLRGGLD